MDASKIPFSLPVLSATESSLYAVLLTAVYVGSLYLSKASRISSSRAPPKGGSQQDERPLGRDDPEVIKARLRMVAGATFACVFGLWGIVQWAQDQHDGGPSSVIPSLATLRTTFHLLSIPTSFRSLFDRPLSDIAALPFYEFVPALIWPSSPLFPYLLAPILFAGPIYSDIKLEGLGLRAALQGLGTLQGLRNYVVAPITEEIVFRSCMIACARLAGASIKSQIFVTPLWFGLAHVHHAYDVFSSRGRNRAAAITAVITCLVQFTYTTLFGWFAAWLLVSSGSILPPLFAHAFCNVMGFPQPSVAMSRHPDRKLDIIVMYFIGIAGFAWAMRSALRQP